MTPFKKCKVQPHKFSTNIQFSALDTDLKKKYGSSNKTIKR